MNKLIKKTALITLAALALLALAVFSLWILISPQTMAGACEKTGNYSFAVTCAGLRYNRTKDSSDLARCAEDSILSGKDGHILNYCAALIGDESYPELCNLKNAEISDGKGGQYISLTGPVNYDGYIKSHLSAAQYRSGNLDCALETVKTDKSGQSLIKLVLAVSDKSDKPAAEKLLRFMEENCEEDNKLVKELTAILNNVNQG